MLKDTSIVIISKAFPTEAEGRMMEQKCIEFRDRIKEVIEEKASEKNNLLTEMLIDICLHKLRKEIAEMKESSVKDNMLLIFKVLDNVTKNELLED